MTDTGIVSGVRLSHDAAAVADLEAAGFDDPDAAVRDLVGVEGVEEALVLQTCHRVEAYAVSEDPDAGRAALGAELDHERAVEMGHEESLRHLLRVAAGLESLVLGEDQILGQVRDAAEAAREAGALGPVLDEAVTKALHVGERARTETAVNEGVVSLGSAAARLVAGECDLAASTALVVGAGEMGTLAAEALASAGAARVDVVNRTAARAATLVEALPAPGEAASLDALADRLADADVVVTATGSDAPVFGADLLGGAGETVVVDLGQPRDVAPAAAAVAAVTVYDLDDLEEVTDETRERRRAAAEHVEAIVDAEFDRLLDQYKRRRADEVIGAMYESAERLKTREVATAVSRLEAAGDLNAEQREVVEALADALVSRLLAAPTKSLRQAAAEDDWSTISTALRLFDPDFEDGAADAPADAPAFVRRLAAEAAAESDDD